MLTRLLGSPDANADGRDDIEDWGTGKARDPQREQEGPALPKIGLHFPSREIESSRAAIRTWVQIATEAGADYINMSDHVLGVDPTQQPEGWDRGWMPPSSVRKEVAPFV